MTDESYGFIIDNMLWSFSRLSSFDDCPYCWKRTYIDCEEKMGNAFASYGTLMHSTLEKYEKGALSIFDISQHWIDNFNDAIPEDFPPNKYVNLRDKYYEQGLDYLDNLDLNLEQYEVLGVEKEVRFEIAGKPFIGFIDLLLKDKETGEIIVADHKSASLKFKKSGEISKSGEAHFLSFKRQLYLYCKPLIEQGMKVDHLMWNLFRERKYLKIPFNQSEYEEAINWASDTIATIEKEELWLPNPDFYRCHNICDHRCFCEYKG